MLIEKTGNISFDIPFEHCFAVAALGGAGGLVDGGVRSHAGPGHPSVAIQGWIQGRRQVSCGVVGGAQSAVGESRFPKMTPLQRAPRSQGGRRAACGGRGSRAAVRKVRYRFIDLVVTVIAVGYLDRIIQMGYRSVLITNSN